MSNHETIGQGLIVEILRDVNQRIEHLRHYLKK
jgi:hypothetical protein